MSLKSLKSRIEKIEHTSLTKLSIEDAIKTFPKDMHKFGFDLSSYLNALDFKLEDIIGYMRRDEMNINFFKNIDC